MAMYLIFQRKCPWCCCLVEDSSILICFSLILRIIKSIVPIIMGFSKSKGYIRNLQWVVSIKTKKLRYISLLNHVQYDL